MTMEIACTSRTATTATMPTGPQTRKLKKPLMEKKRRARINRCLTDLKNLLLQSAAPQGAKLEKADILEMTVHYLENARKSRTEIDNAAAMTKFADGYKSCVHAVMQFLSSTQAMGLLHPLSEPARSALTSNLLGHLHQTAVQLTSQQQHQIPAHRQKFQQPEPQHHLPQQQHSKTAIHGGQPKPMSLTMTSQSTVHCMDVSAPVSSSGTSAQQPKPTTSYQQSTKSAFTAVQPTFGSHHHQLELQHRGFANTASPQSKYPASQALNPDRAPTPPFLMNSNHPVLDSKHPMTPLNIPGTHRFPSGHPPSFLSTLHIPQSPLLNSASSTCSSSSGDSMCSPRGTTSSCSGSSHASSVSPRPMSPVPNTPCATNSPGSNVPSGTENVWRPW